MKKVIATAAIVMGATLTGASVTYAATAQHSPGSYCKIADHGKSGTYTTPKTNKTYAVQCKSYTAWHWVKK